jgi:hypothetical protein
MTQAKIEPGETDLTLAGKRRSAKPNAPQDPLAPRTANAAERPAAGKAKSEQTKASPLDSGIDLGE